MRGTLLRATLAAVLVLLGAGTAFATDTDGDGLSDAVENAIGTDPEVTNTDLSDTYDDFTEFFVEGTNPLLFDSDGDLLLDHEDSEPLHASLTSYDGSPAPLSHDGFPGRCACGPTCEEPTDGVGVNLTTGAFRMSVAIGGASAPGDGSVQPVLVARYNSQGHPSAYAGNWTLVIDTIVTELTSSVELLDFDGTVMEWEKVGSDYVAPTGCLDTLEKVGSQFVRTSPDGRKVTYGSLDKIEDVHGNTLDFTYSAGRPVSFTDQRGETHTLSYYGSGRLEKLTMADGAEWTLKYNTSGQLWMIVGPSTESFPDGITKEFRYTNGGSNPDLIGNLVAASDGDGNWWLRNQYDENDRVVKQYVRGPGHFDFDYSEASSQRVTVSDRMGNERVWEWHATKLTKTKLIEKTNRGVRSGEGDYTTEWAHDAAGYLISVKYPRGNGVKYTLNTVKLPTEVRRKALMTADDDDEADLIDLYSYDSSKYYGMTSHTDPEGNETTYTLNSKGQPTTVTFPEVGGVAATNGFTYNSDGSLATSTDGEGYVTSYSYYGSGPRKGLLQTKVVDSGTGGLALSTSYDYEDWGDVKSVTDPRGNTTTYTVERYGNVEEVASPSSLGYVTQYDYNGSLGVVEKRVKNVDWDGTALTSPVAWWTTTTIWNPYLPLEIHETDGTTSRTTFLMHDLNENRTQVSRGMHAVQMLYDERDLLFRRTRELGLTDPVEEWTYDGNRNVTATLNPRGKSTSFTYDDFDRRTRTTNALGHYQEIVYDKDGHALEWKSYEEAGATDVLRAHHKSHYDAMGRHWQEEDALLGTSTTWYARTFELDKRGLLTSLTDRRSYETVHVYDGAGRRTSTTDPVGNVTEWEYDANGNATAVEETEKIPGSSSTETYRTEMEYDALNRLKKRTEIDRTNSSNTKVTEWKRSVLGLRKTIDPKGNEVVFSLDGYGRVTQKSEDLGSSAAVVTQWEYLTTDEVSILRDDNGSETAYSYDSLGRLENKLYENAKEVSYQYDLNGNVTEIEDQNGSVIAQGFDDLDRMTVRSVTPATGVGGDTESAFSYDALNRLTEASDDDSVVQFTYDSLSRVLTEVQGSNPLGTTGKTVTYTWDEEGNRTKIDYPSGFDANETRDSLGRLTEIKDGSNVTVAAFDLYGAGLRRKKVTLPNTTTANFSYDGFRRPTEIAHKSSGGTKFAGFTYAWDKNDNPLMEARSHLSGKGDVYTYDKVNRLTKVLRDVDDPAAELATPNSEAYVTKLEYDMDDVFNLTAYKTTPYGASTTTLSYTTNAMNEYTAIGGQTPTYTDAGSLADDDTYSYKYDAHQHLIEVKQGSTTIATYQYDALGLGRRIGKMVGGSAVTRYVHAGQQAIEEYDGTGSSANLSRLFVFGEQIDQVVAMEAPDVADVDSDSNTSEVLRFSYHSQLIGSVSHVTAPDQSICESYLYDPYGKATVKDAAGAVIAASAVRNPYLFTGRQFDDETKLYYFRARHFSPSIQRFIQRDPLEYTLGPNPLTYVAGAPTRFLDPQGLGAVGSTDLAGGTVGLGAMGVTYNTSFVWEYAWDWPWNWKCWLEVTVCIDFGLVLGAAFEIPFVGTNWFAGLESPPPAGGDGGIGGTAGGGVAAGPDGPGPGLAYAAYGSESGVVYDSSPTVGLGLFAYVGVCFTLRYPCPPPSGGGPSTGGGPTGGPKTGGGDGGGPTTGCGCGTIGGLLEGGLRIIEDFWDSLW